MADHWKEKEQFLTGLITDAARRRLGRAEDARDCVVIFLEKALEIPEAQEWPFSAEAAASLTAAAERCADAERSKLRRLRRREMFIADMSGGGTYYATPDPADRSTGPEQRSVLSNTTDLIVLAVSRLPQFYQALFEAVFFEHNTPTEVARAIGRSQQSIDRSVRRMKAAIRGILANMGLTDSDVNDLLNLADRCGNRMGTARRTCA